MNSSFVAISTLVKSNIGKKCLVNILMNISTNALKDYLNLANIYKGKSSKKKTNLVEIIVYGYITNKIDEKDIKDISPKEANQILKEKGIIVQSLPGHGNAELRKKYIMANVMEKPSPKLKKKDTIANVVEKPSIKIYD